MKAFLKKYWEYIAALFVPFLLVLIHCITRGVWIFGDGSMLRGDANIQYIYLFEELWTRVHNGDFSFFSWNALGGFDYYLNALYYVISPATIVVMLLPKEWIHDVLQFFIIFKWMLMCVTAVYYFMHTRFNRIKEYKRWVSFALGLCYIMGNYFIGILSLFNWLDSLILFPILLLLVEKMVDSQKWKLYYVVLTVSMFCNFYITFPICIFLFLWFLLLLRLSPSNCWNKIRIFITSSVLSAISALGIILPCILNVKERYILGQENEDMTYISTIRLSLTEWIQRFFIFDTTDVYKLKDTPFYFSIGLLLLSLLFVFINMNKHEKKYKLLITGFIIVSFFVGILNYMWHGFSIPHGIDQRYAFLFYMMICVMVLDVIYCLDDIKLRHVFVIAIVSVGLFIYVFFNIKVLNEFYVYLCTLLLLCFYVILLVLYCRKSIKKESFVVVILLICVLEVCANAYVQLQSYAVLEPYNRDYIADIDPLAESVHTDLGERAVITDAGYNIGLKYSIPNMSGFVSYSNGDMSNLSMYHGMNILNDAGTLYGGVSPVINYMFNICHGIGAWETEFSDVSLVAKNNRLSLYEMQRRSSLGYMVKDTAKEWDLNGYSVWKTQNQYIESMLGEKNDVFEVFIPKDIECKPVIGVAEVVSRDEENGNIAYGYTAAYEKDGNIIRFTADQDMDLYVNIKGDHRVLAYVSVDYEKVYQDLDGRGQTSVHIGEVKAGQNVSVVCVIEDAANEHVEVMVSFAKFDQEAFEKAYQKLSKNLYEVTEMQGDTVKGTIKADEAGIMMTSIPAMNGFTVYVDGTETAYETIGGALIGVPLKAGEHQVEFHYETRYAKLAWLLSLAGVVIFGVICGVDYYRKKKAVQE